jgi:hypothetical protein
MKRTRKTFAELIALAISCLLILAVYSCAEVISKPLPSDDDQDQSEPVRVPDQVGTLTDDGEGKLTLSIAIDWGDALDSGRSVTSDLSGNIADGSLINYIEMIIIDESNPGEIYQYASASKGHGGALTAPVSAGGTYHLLLLMGSWTWRRGSYPNIVYEEDMPILLASGFVSKLMTNGANSVTIQMKPVVVDTHLAKEGASDEVEPGRLIRTVGLEAGATYAYRVSLCTTEKFDWKGDDVKKAGSGEAFAPLLDAQTKAYTNLNWNGLMLRTNTASYMRVKGEGGEDLSPQPVYTDSDKLEDTYNVAANDNYDNPWPTSTGNASYVFTTATAYPTVTKNRYGDTINSDGDRILTFTMEYSPFSKNTLADWSPNAEDFTTKIYDTVPLWKITNSINVAVVSTSLTPEAWEVGPNSAGLYEDNNPWPVMQYGNVDLTNLQITDLRKTLEFLNAEGSSARYGSYTLRLGCNQDYPARITLGSGSSTLDISGTNGMGEWAFPNIKNIALTIESTVPQVIVTAKDDYNTDSNSLSFGKNISIKNGWLLDLDADSTVFDQWAVNDYPYTYDDTTKVFTIADTGKQVYVSDGPDANTTSTTNTRRIVIPASTTANVTLDGASIDHATAAAILVDPVGGKLNVTLADGSVNTLKSGKDTAGQGYAGLTCNDGATLVIDGEGRLHATAGEYSAGIGGNEDSAGGDITISGGLVEAIGGEYAAGIGGGGGGAAGGTITITGGTVSAIGKGVNNSGGGAGIGGGYSGNGGTITIEGGSVRAIGGQHAAAIGGGSSGAGGNITIRGETVVYAYTWSNGYWGYAAIGGGVAFSTDATVPNTGAGTIRIGVDDSGNPSGNPTVVAIIDSNDVNDISIWPGIGSGPWVSDAGSITIGSGTIISNGVIGRGVAPLETTPLNPTPVTIIGGVQIVSNINTDGSDVTPLYGVQALRARGTVTAIANARVDPSTPPNAPWSSTVDTGTTFPSGTITLSDNITRVSAFTLPAGWTLSGGTVTGTATGSNVNLNPSPITWPDGTTTP